MGTVSMLHKSDGHYMTSKVQRGCILLNSPSGYEWREAGLGLFLLLLLAAALLSAAARPVLALLDRVGERQTLAWAWTGGIIICRVGSIVRLSRYV